MSDPYFPKDRIDQRPTILRFDLVVGNPYQPGDSSERRACFDIPSDSTDEDLQAVFWRADRDDVAAICRGDQDIIGLQGGMRWVGHQYDMRARRRQVYQSIAGRLGAHLCDILERQEGWADAPKE